MNERLHYMVLDDAEITTLKDRLKEAGRWAYVPIHVDGTNRFGVRIAVEFIPGYWPSGLSDRFDKFDDASKHADELNAGRLTEDEATRIVCSTMRKVNPLKLLLISDIFDMYELDAWSEFIGFPRSEWIAEVENKDTSLGYWEWVSHKVEEYKHHG